MSRQGLMMPVLVTVMMACLTLPVAAREAEEVEPVVAPTPQNEVPATQDDKPSYWGPDWADDEEDGESDADGDELEDPEGWHQEPDGSIVLGVDEKSGQAYWVPDDCEPWSTEGMHWVDRTHYSFSRGLCWPTRWFDSVFGDADDQDRESVGTSVRIVGAQLLQEDGERSSDVRFRVRAHLPGVERRLSLVFASERDFEDDNAGLPGSPETTGQREDNAFRAGLNWVLSAADNSDLDMDIGLRSNFKTFWRTRYRVNHPLSENWRMRFTETVDWRDTRGFRSRSVFDLDRPIGRHKLFRLTSFAEVSNELVDEGRHWFWQQSGALGMELTKRSALRYLVSVEGFTRPETRVENYRSGVTYRRNTWRPWFFYEIEPYLLWPRESRYRTTTGVVLRVETQFGIL